jgi:glycerol-3-phosphate dehydrogenase
VLARRLQLLHLAPAASVKCAAAVARKMRELLQWTAAREAAELAAYLEEVKRSRLFRTEVTGGSKAAAR